MRGQRHLDCQPSDPEAEVLPLRRSPAASCDPEASPPSGKRGRGLQVSAVVLGRKKPAPVEIESASLVGQNVMGIWGHDCALDIEW